MKTIISLTRKFTAPFILCFAALFLMSFQGSQVQKIAIQNADYCPIASFSVSNNGHLLGVETVFLNQSSGAISYLWNFGDGNSSNEQHPRHIYQETGNYSVTLTVYFDGCEHSIIGIVDVIDA